MFQGDEIQQVENSAASILTGRFFVFFLNHPLTVFLSSFLPLFLHIDFILRLKKQQKGKTKVMNLANDGRPTIQTSRQS